MRWPTLATHRYTLRDAEKEARKRGARGRCARGRTETARGKRAGQRWRPRRRCAREATLWARHAPRLLRGRAAAAKTGLGCCPACAEPAPRWQCAAVRKAQAVAAIATFQRCCSYTAPDAGSEVSGAAAGRALQEVGPYDSKH